MTCHACARRDRYGRMMAEVRGESAPPPAGEYYVITGPNHDSPEADTAE